MLLACNYSAQHNQHKPNLLCGPVAGSTSTTHSIATLQDSFPSKYYIALKHILPLGNSPLLTIYWSFSYTPAGLLDRVGSECPWSHNALGSEGRGSEQL